MNDTPIARIVTITQQMATELLNKNKRNRRVSDKNFTKLKRALLRGEWRLNGEAIKVDVDGRVLDGQHRLLAVEDTGIPMQTFMITGLPADTQDTMDTGKSRSIADVLAIRGYKNTATLSAILRRIYIYETHGLKAATQAAYPTTNHEVLAFFDSHPQIEELIAPARKAAQHGKLPGGLAGLLRYVFTGIDPDDTDDFFEKLCTGADMEARNPVLVLRESLKRLKDDKGTINQTYLAAICIKAWNKYRAGESVGTLKFTPGGATPEKFPEPK